MDFKPMFTESNKNPVPKFVFPVRPNSTTSTEATLSHERNYNGTSNTLTSIKSAFNNITTNLEPLTSSRKVESAAEQTSITTEMNTFSRDTLLNSTTTTTQSSLTFSKDTNVFFNNSNPRLEQNFSNIVTTINETDITTEALMTEYVQDNTEAAFSELFGSVNTAQTEGNQTFDMFNTTISEIFNATENGNGTRSNSVLKSEPYSTLCILLSVVVPLVIIVMGIVLYICIRQKKKTFRLKHNVNEMSNMNNRRGNENGLEKAGPAEDHLCSTAC